MASSTSGPAPRLPEVPTAPGRAGLAALLDDPARAVVALDFDGTLAPIVERPEDARPHPRALAALTGLSAAVGTVVVVTGRPAATVVELGGFADAPGLEGLLVLGHYGLERWDGRTREVEAPEPHPGVERLRAPLRELVESVAGAVLEDKGASLAVHTRRADDPSAALQQVEPRLRELADGEGLETVPGRYVLEVRPPGVDKGSALRSVVEERAARAVLFAGDDLGDLPAFDAVETLRGEGVAGLLVASGSDEVTALAERADLVVDGPEAAIALLEALVAAVGTP